ncbi:hypothetical protein ABK040_006916 [Willaertia magna]
MLDSNYFLLATLICLVIGAISWVARIVFKYFRRSMLFRKLESQLHTPVQHPDEERKEDDNERNSVIIHDNNDYNFRYISQQPLRNSSSKENTDYKALVRYCIIHLERCVSSHDCELALRNDQTVRSYFEYLKYRCNINCEHSMFCVEIYEKASYTGNNVKISKGEFDKFTKYYYHILSQINNYLMNR